MLQRLFQAAARVVGVVQQLVQQRQRFLLVAACAVAQPLSQRIAIGAHGRQDIAIRHFQHGHSLDARHLAIVFRHDGAAGAHFGCGKYLVRFKERNVLVGYIVRQAIGRGAQIEQAAALCLGNPCIVVSVAVEDNALVRADGIPDQGMQGILKAIGLFQDIGILAQGFSEKESLALTATDLGHGDGRGRWVKQVYGYRWREE